MTSDAPMMANLILPLIIQYFMSIHFYGKRLYGHMFDREDTAFSY